MQPAAAAAWPRVFQVGPERCAELTALPDALPPAGFLWLAFDRSQLAAQLPALQAALHRWGLAPLIDLHVSDLLNGNLPSHFDATSWYDLMVFRRLAAATPELTLSAAVATAVQEGDEPAAGGAPQAPAEVIETRAVGFAIYDRVLISVHPPDGQVLSFFAQRLATLAGGQAEATRGVRLPPSPSDLMLRMLNHMVDGYLELRRLLTARFGELQRSLLDPSGRFTDWSVMLQARNALHMLEDTCEDQHAAVQEWLDALAEWPPTQDEATQRERELLRVRARDVQEHIERVLRHIQRLEQSAETAVQLHFSAVGHRTNDIMRTLTVLTALFLPLNLITGFFGMNFDGLPLIHSSTGVWIAVGMMLLIFAVFAVFFWRRRFVGTGRPRL